jgi:hypothetical protein
VTVTDNSGATATASVLITVTNSPPIPPGPNDIVLYASEAPVKAGNWTVVTDTTAAGGARLRNPNAGAARIDTALANPVHYFEMTFDAQSGTGYRLWIRGKADSDYWGNDSVHVQFSGSVTDTGSAVYRIGTTSATFVNLEDCNSCKISGWGWQDNGYGAGVLGPLIYFQTSGTQTIRVQVREDGFSIDQIVLSPDTFVTTSPGALKNDTVILPKSGGGGGGSGSMTAVMYASEAEVKAGNWTVVADSTAAGGARLRNPNAGAARINTPLANPVDYFEMSFSAQAGTPYHLWLRSKADNDGWANDSVWVQFSGSVTASGSAVSRIGTTSAEMVNLEDCSGCDLSNWGWQDNGYGAGVLGPLIYFQSTGTQTIRIQVREDGLSIDQIVLSPDTYLNSSPGDLKDDTTILPESGGDGSAATANHEASAGEEGQG